MAKHAIDLARRAEIGAKRRAKTRAQLLAAARTLFGRQDGRATRVEDICERAAIARGTFYNYFPSFDALQAALLEDLSDRFDQAVHEVFAELEGGAERTCAAVRFYMTHVVEDRQWGWGMVNLGMGIGFFPASVSERVAETIQEGINSGDFTIPDVAAGRDILLGAGLAAATTLLNGNASNDHVENVTAGVLQSLGLPAERARQLSRAPLPKLPFVEAPTPV